MRSMRVPRWMHALSVLTMALGTTFISACATINVALLPSQGVLQADQGIALLSITSNTQLGQFDSVNLTRTTESGARETKILPNVATGLGRDTALFVGIVPAGEYWLELLSVGKQFISVSEGSRKMMGAVHVTAGTVADLGRVIVTPFNERVLIGRSALVTSNIELIRRFSPENATSLKGEIHSGWASPRQEQDRIEEYAFSRPMGADTPIELPSGEVAAASRLGTVLIRNAEGHWRAARTGKLESLLAVSPVASGKVDNEEALLVAVGEFNTIARLDSTGRMSVLDPGNLPLGNLLMIDGSETSGWYVAHQSRTKVAILRSNTLNNGNWLPIRTEDISPRFWMWRTPYGFSYAVSEGGIHAFDYSTQSWTERRAPNGEGLFAVAPSAGDELGILTSGGLRTMYLSRDGGASWTEIKSPSINRFFAPLPLADNTLLVLVGAAFAKAKLHASTDKGITWQLRSDQFKLQENIVVLPTRGLLAVGAGLTQIRHSSDGGATWRTEY